MITPAGLVIYEQTIDGFVRSLSGKVTPRLKGKLRDLGVDLDQKLKPMYPLDTWIAVVRTTCEELYPGIPEREALHQMGRGFIQGFRETLLGRTVLSIARLLGPTRTLQRTAQNFAAGGNYLEAKVTEIGPGHCELWMNRAGERPWFTEGVVYEGLVTAGAKDISIEVRDHDGSQATFVIRWKEGKA